MKRHLGIILAAAMAAPAAAHDVDIYQFDRLSGQVEQMRSELGRLSNAVAGGDTLRKFDQIAGEISRLTGEIERLSFQIRTFEGETKRKLEDLEYRIIELEGGDPDALFENNTDEGLQRQGELSDRAQTQGLTAEQQATVRPLGQTGGQVASVANSAERQTFEAGSGAVRAGRYAEGRNILAGFVSAYPDSALAGEATYWLAEAYFGEGDYQRAASRYLDGATLFPRSALAAESLLKLGITLTLLGQGDVACSTFRELQTRFPSSGDTLRKAEVEASRAGCA